MQVDDLLQWLTQGFLLLIAVLTLIDVARYRDQTRIDIALMFAALAAIVLIQGLTTLIRQQIPWLGRFGTILLFAQPYLVLRLVQHFRTIPRFIHVFALGGMLVSWALLIDLPTPLPKPVALLIVVYFVSVEGYAGWAFARGALRTNGVTHNRLLLAASGSCLLAGILLLAGINLVFPTGTGIATSLSRLLALLCMLSYYFGFVPPRWLRRAWQLNELQRFLQAIAGRAANARVAAVLNQLCLSGTQAVGGLGAVVALYDTPSEELVIRASSGLAVSIGTSLSRTGAIGRAWHTGHSIYTVKQSDFGKHVAPLAAEIGAAALLIAPITTVEHRWGVLTVFLSRGSLFVTDDLNLLALLTEQSAITLDADNLQREMVKRERAEAIHNEQLKHMQEAVQVRDEFLSIASHELKTPLTSLLGNVHVLERRAKREGGWTTRNLEALHVIGSQAQRLNMLISSLLDLSRIDNGQLRIERRPLDLNALTQRVVNEMLPTFDSRQTLQLHKPDEALIIAGDELRLEQVLQNLLSNAAKYSVPDGVISVSVCRDATIAQLIVTDHGIGIPEEALPQLFQRFFRAPNVDYRQISGVGIGLFVVKEIVELHGGKVEVRSIEGQGSSFTVCLPLLEHRDSGSKMGE